MKLCWIGIIGRPNVGKSSLLNEIIDYDLSIVSNKPQTTRDQILGIYNDEKYQWIFLDTPGIHKPLSKLGEELNKRALDTINDVDLILFLQPINEVISKGDLIILEKIKNFKNKIALITKIDLIKEDNDFLLKEKIKILDEYQFKKIFPISIKKRTSIDNLIEEFKKFSYEGQNLYEKDAITDRSELFLAKEIIRSSAIKYLNDELPHSIAVEITKYDINEKENFRIIEATIFCKKESQKGIIIGKNGSMIKKIGTLSRKTISQKFCTNVNLKLIVKINKNWINNEKTIKKFHY